MNLFWENINPATFLHDEIEGYNKPVRARMRSIVSALPIRTVLEVGCGSGVDCGGFQQVRPDVAYTGVDFTEVMTAYCSSVYPQCTFLNGDIYALPVESETFDLVYCKDLLNHLDDWERGLSELMRVSKRFVMINFFYELGTVSERFEREGYIDRYISWSEALVVMESYLPKFIMINPIFCPPNGKETLILIEKSASQSA